MLSDHRKDVSIISLAIMAIVLLIIGYTLRAVTSGTPATDKAHTHDNQEVLDNELRSGYEVLDVNSAPKVTSLQVEQDEGSGVNIQFEVENFTLMPQLASLPHVEGEGYVDLFIDGKKEGRLYSPYAYVGNLSPGEHTIGIILVTNDHNDYLLNGGPIEFAKEVIIDMDDRGDVIDEHTHDGLDPHSH